MKPTLLILAAGMGSRYGGIKQMDAFGPSGETIIDYSIYDAIKSGFGKVVFIIREDFAEEFKNIFETKLKGKIPTEYVMQEMESFTDGFKLPENVPNPGALHMRSYVQRILFMNHLLLLMRMIFMGETDLKRL